jgi:hypothetical protein
MGALTGPTTKRLPAPEPSFTPAARGLTRGIFQGGAGYPGSTVEQRFGASVGFGLPPELQNAMKNYLAQPTAAQRAADFSLPALQRQLEGEPGADTLAALQPLYQQNLASVMNNGPRFSSGNERLQLKALQDFTLFQAQTREQAANRQIQAALAAGQVGAGAAQANAQQLQTYGGLTQQQQQIMLQALGPFIQALLNGGLSSGIAVGPSVLGQIASLGGTAAAVYTAGKGPGTTAPATPAAPTGPKLPV